MATKEEFNLESFLTDSLNLRMNTTYPTKPMFSVTEHDPYCDLIKEDPLVVLGERKFGPPRDVPEDVIGTPIQEFFRGAHVLITGGTGFVGKVLTEKLVRSVPHLGHVYLLIRAKRGVSSQQRFDKLLEDQLYSRMKAEVPQYQSKISVVEGDLSEPDLGLSAADRQMLLDNVHVVFHSAADVRFIEPLRSALISNVIGGKKVLDLAKGMKNLKSYVHVSTAYSQCYQRLVKEEVPKISISYKKLLTYLDTMTDQQLEQETPRIIAGWPNTYTFSKAVCEDMIQEEARGLPVCIFRPSVVVSTYKEPVRGWTDNLNGPLGVFLGAGLGVLHALAVSSDLPMDTVPVDYVVNSMIASAWSIGISSDHQRVPVINFCSTAVRPMKWKSITDTADRSGDIYPLANAIWYQSFMHVKSKWAFEVAHFFLHKIPGILIDKITEISGQKPRLTKAYDRIYLLKDQLHFFIFSIFEFESENAKDLWRVLSVEDRKLFNFDLSDVDMAELFLVGKLGLRYYFLKEKMETLPAAIFKNRWLYWVHVTLKTVCGLAVLKLMALTAHALPI